VALRRYEAMIFSLACEGLHPDDAYQVESLLAFMIQVGGGTGVNFIVN
jgi:hypothetical protein